MPDKPKTEAELKQQRWSCLFHREQPADHVDVRLQTARCPRCNRLMTPIAEGAKPR